MRSLLRFYHRRRVSPVVAANVDLAGNVARIEAERPRDGTLERPTTRVSQLSNIIKTFFDLAAVFCVAPFRIVLENNVCCVLMHLMCVVRLISESRQTLQFGIGKLPPSIKAFKVVNVLTTFIYKMLALRRFWFNQKNYLEIFQRIQDTPSFSLISFKVLRRPCVGAIFLVPVLQIIMSTISGKGFIPLSKPWSITLWSNQLLKFSRYSFFVDDSGLGFFDSNTTANWTIYDVPMSFLISIGSFQRQAVGTLYEVLVTSFTFTLWIAVRCFATDIRRDTGNALTYEQVLNRLDDLAKLSSAINDALGSHVFWMLAESVLYYAINLTDVATNPHPIVRLDALIFYVIFLANLLVSADIRKQLLVVDIIWLNKASNRRYHEFRTYNLLKSTQDKIGIEIDGSSTISYSFVAGYAVIVVSYFIICIQDGFKITMPCGIENYTIAMIPSI
ncbi:hypothetical protein Ocin01_07799 [Orchesella cincta]|uniref:Gustatory receptor n=1 Tax=Orchesella cincta TaxID=48709 RepID=A0A1D2N0T9_ORCCI|nr:hypothetical protein Ocin01_07799 [Orchesella cincta]